MNQKRILFIFLILFSIGCKLQLHKENMSFRSRTMHYAQSGQSAWCTTTFGFARKAYWTKVINNNLNAIDQSLKTNVLNTNLFTLDSLNPDIHINSHIDDCWQSTSGLDCLTHLRISYSCTRNDSTIFASEINNTFSSTFSDAAVGATRCRKSIEGAIRENHKLFIVQLHDHFNKK